MRMSDLEKVAYFEKLGSIANKVERMVKLSEWIGKRLGLSSGEQIIVQRIAELCKADLTTKMVYEFPELQGTMGKEYALRSNEDPKVASGIFEHYLPRFAEDVLPSSLAGTVVALADRIDTLVGSFSIGAIPSGSVDPYGLRRSVIGIVRIVVEKKLDLLLDEAIEHSHKLYEPVFLAFLFFAIEALLLVWVFSTKEIIRATKKGSQQQFRFFSKSDRRFAHFPPFVIIPLIRFVENSTGVRILDVDFIDDSFLVVDQAEKKGVFHVTGGISDHQKLSGENRIERSAGRKLKSGGRLAENFGRVASVDHFDPPVFQ